MASNCASTSPSRNTSRVSQLQTQPAHQNRNAPQSTKDTSQEVLFTTFSNDPCSPCETPTSSSVSSSSPEDTTSSQNGRDKSELVRCSRCQRSMSDTIGGSAATAAASSGASPDEWSTNRTGMVKFGHNLYYCARCASMVGLGRKR